MLRAKESYFSAQLSIVRPYSKLKRKSRSNVQLAKLVIAVFANKNLMEKNPANIKSIIGSGIVERYTDAQNVLLFLRKMKVATT